MPLCKPQSMKSLKTIGLQPKNVDTPKIDAIICMDIAGKGTGDIARELGMTASRISIIKGSPLYIQQRDVEREKLKNLFQDKQSDLLASGDPVENALKDAALDAAKMKIHLMENGRSEFVKLAASGDILDRAGYKAHQDKTIISVQITEKMSERFERAITYQQTRHNNTTKQQNTSIHPVAAAPAGDLEQVGPTNGGAVTVET